MKQHAFQVRFNIIRPKYKAFVVSGIVLATTQALAVSTAKETLEATLAESDKHEDSVIKLIGASPLKNDFFLIAQEKESKFTPEQITASAQALAEESKEVTNK